MNWYEYFGGNQDELRQSLCDLIGHVNNIPRMQFVTVISKNTCPIFIWYNDAAIYTGAKLKTLILYSLCRRGSNCIVFRKNGKCIVVDIFLEEICG